MALPLSPETSQPTRIGHEFVGVVEDLGSEVSTLKVGDFVIAPFALSDNTCAHCRNGVHTSCERGAWWGGKDEHELPDAARPGGRVGYVGVPAGGAELPIRQLFSNNISVGGGVAPVRGYLDELLAATLEGSIYPGRVFDLQLPLDRVAEAYVAMDERRSIKTLLRP